MYSCQYPFIVDLTLDMSIISAPPSAGGGSGQRVRRQAVATDSGLWPEGRITYTFSSKYTVI